MAKLESYSGKELILKQNGIEIPGTIEMSERYSLNFWGGEHLQRRYWFVPSDGSESIKISKKGKNKVRAVKLNSGLIELIN